MEDGTLDFSDVDDIYLEGGIVNEGLYGINLGSNAMSIAYDAEIFAEAGVPELEPGYTWDDYIEAVKTIHENLDGMYAYGFGDSLNFLSIICANMICGCTTKTTPGLVTTTTNT